MSVEGVERVITLFEHHFTSGLHPGAQLVVLRRGRVVLDRSIGLSREGTYLSVRPDTIFLTLSCTKPVASFCLHQLVDAGKVEIDAPIATYWPEFGQKGKETATVRHALLHQSGIPSKGLYPQIPQWWNWERVTQSVAELTAEFEPGSRTAYHLVNYGFILGEIIRRVDGRMPDEYMRQELFEPLGMENAYLGLPRTETERAAELYWGASDQRNAALLFRQARYAMMPAATLNCSARDLAQFYQMIVDGGRVGERQLLSREVLDLMLTEHYAGYDHLLESFVRAGHGIYIGGAKPVEYAHEYSTFGRLSRRTTVGHPGQRSCNAWADPQAELVVIYLNNRLIGKEENEARWQNMSDAVWRAIEEE